MIFPLLSIVSLTNAVLFVAAWTAKRIKAEQYIDHRRPVKEWVIKAVSGLPAIVFLVFKYDFEWMPWQQVVIAPLLVMFWYWLLFDSTLGVMLGKGIFYTGTDWNGRAKTARIPFAVKVGAVGVLTTLYIIL